MQINHDSQDRWIYPVSTDTHPNDPDDSEMGIGRFTHSDSGHDWTHVASKGCITSPVEARRDKGTKEWRSEVTQLTNIVNEEVVNTIGGQ